MLKVLSLTHNQKKKQKKKNKNKKNLKFWTQNSPVVNNLFRKIAHPGAFATDYMVYT